MEQTGKYKCNDCGGRFHTGEEMKNHAKEAHGMELTDEQAEMMNQEHEHEK